MLRFIKLGAGLFMLFWMLNAFYIISTFVNVMLYLQYNYNMLIKIHVSFSSDLSTLLILENAESLEK
jgi:hypothetical protein